jgi:hypothetical protein
MPDPIAIQIKDDRGQVKIHRSLEADIDLSELPMKASFGNGSRGNRGAGNRGNAFEIKLAEDLELFARTRNLNKDYRYKNFIQSFCAPYISATDIEIISEGALNKKRPLVISGNKVLISGGGNIGKTVTDITFVHDGKPEYLSLKLGGTVTFFNIGIKKIITSKDINNYNISKKGLALLNLFGIDETKFCDVFNSYNKNSESGEIQERPNFDKKRLEEFLASGIGYGYWMVHAKSATSTDIHYYYMDKNTMQNAVKVQDLTVRYPIGKAKRIDIFIKTPVFTFKLNIRSKDGGLYPTHIMCDYKYNH